MVIIRKVVIIFLRRNTPNNKFVNVTNKETNKVMWHRCSSQSIMKVRIYAYIAYVYMYYSVYMLILIYLCNFFKIKESL